MERDQLIPKLAAQLQPADHQRMADAVHLCGFGIVAAAARTAMLLALHRPQRVLLIGIAGSYSAQRIPVGSALHFDRVACDGIGVGCGDQFVAASSLGWFQFDPGQPPGRSATLPTQGHKQTSQQVGDVIPLATCLESTCLESVNDSTGTLLTCCAASANRQEAAARRSRFPEAVAEDMEGFGVAMACALAGVPLQIIRGISNEVGDRDHQNWQINAALTAAAALAAERLRLSWMPSTLSDTDGSDD